jgi:hypothetical protein
MLISHQPRANRQGMGIAGSDAGAQSITAHAMRAMSRFEYAVS